MRVSTGFELEWGEDSYWAELEGWAAETPDGKVEVELWGVAGLPEGMEQGDLDPRTLEDFVEALYEVAAEKLAKRAKLAKQLSEVSGLLRRMLEAPRPTGEFAAEERVGALTYTMERAQAELQRLAKLAAEVAS